MTVIVPFAPGGSTDILGRYAAQVLQRDLKQTFIVENRTGAGGVIGIGAAAKALPDGYTLLHAPTAFGLLPYLMKSVPYDPAKDFEPIVLIGLTEFSLVVSPKLPVKSVADVIALAKQRPGSLTYASAGIGTTQQLFAELFKSMTGTDIRQIPYKGTAPGLVDVMSGDVSMMFTDIGPAMSLIKDGKLKMLGVTSLERNSDMPDVPTIAETVPGYQAVGWQGLFARAGTPKDIVDKLNTLLVADLKKAGDCRALQEDRRRGEMVDAGGIPRLGQLRKREVGQGHQGRGNRAAVTQSRRLMLRGPPIAGVSKHAGPTSFETRPLGAPQDEG